MIKVYCNAPLPFRGQKRNFIRLYKEVLDGISSSIDTVVDMFGGSGILSRVTKDILPSCKVVYNDYDHYCNRLDNIATTNTLINTIYKMVNGIVYYKKHIPNDLKNKILDIILKTEQSNTYVDYLTISQNICFSNHYVNCFEELKKETLYNMVRTNDYSCSNYLDGLDVVHKDYLDLYKDYNNDHTMFILDPPYMNTDNTGYCSGSEWSIKEYLDIITLFNDKKYIMFTSNKSNIVELCNWINTNTSTRLLDGTRIYERNNCVTRNANYQDIMIVNNSIYS